MSEDQPDGDSDIRDVRDLVNAAEANILAAVHDLDRSTEANHVELASNEEDMLGALSAKQQESLYENSEASVEMLHKIKNASDTASLGRTLERIEELLDRIVEKVGA